MKKIPLRKCVATGEKLPKKELIRIVRTPENEVKVDLTSRLNGRGVYLKKSLEAIEIAQQKKALDKSLECKVEIEIYEELKQIVSK